MTELPLSGKRLEILDFIDRTQRGRGYPPSVREICEAVGLTSTSTVHAHLSTLQKQGFLRRDPTKPRALEVRYDSASGTALERRPVHHVPLVGDVAAGTDVLAQENIEDLYPLPEDFTGAGQLFMLRVRGDSMIEAGILDGDTVVIRKGDTADNGQIIVALIDDAEVTLKRLRRRGNSVALEPANQRHEIRIFPADRVKVQGSLVALLRRY